MTTPSAGLAVAQIASIAGDVTANVNRHVEVTRAAVANSVGLLVFPELSLTGYEPNLAAETAILGTSDVLSPLREVASQAPITLVVGCPLDSGLDRPYLAALAIGSAGIDIYRKRFLHGEEHDFFLPGRESVVITAAERQVGLAVCADIHEPQHDRDLIAAGASVYASGVAIKQASLRRAHDEMSAIAARHGMITMMSNYCQPTGGYDTRGGSGVWDESGKCLGMAADSQEQLVIAACDGTAWSTTVVDV